VEQPPVAVLAPASRADASVALVENRVLLAEDDRATRESLVRALELEGYQVRAVADGSGVFEALQQEPADVLLLDLMMPHVGGLTVCQRLRARGDRTPILIVTARTEVSDRVAGLDAGADDYLPKPFALDELFARVRALLRRASYDEPDRELHVADLRLDEAARRAWRGDRELELTKTEFDLLQLFARNAGIVLTHTTIYERIWNYDFGPESKALSVYVGYLRRKTEAAGEPRLLQTVRGVGYTLRAP
jgi:two-component system response regulator MprA